MSDERELALLVDLARLLKKYGPDVFEGLAQTLSSPELPVQLARILSTTARAVRVINSEGPLKSGPRTVKDLRACLSARAATEPNKGSLLILILEGLLTKSLLPTHEDLQVFALANGLSAVRAPTRAKAIVQLIDQLGELPQDRFEQISAKLRELHDAGDRSLARWTDLILNNGRRGGPVDERPDEG